MEKSDNEAVNSSTPQQQRATISFSIADQVGALDEVLKIIRSLNVNMSRIESRPSRTADYDYEFFVDFDLKQNGEERKIIQSLIDSLRPVVKTVTLVGSSAAPGTLPPTIHIQPIHHIPSIIKDSTIPWFPRKKKDLDTFASKVLEYGAQLDADHPGFTDPDYRKRRAEITALARQYRTGNHLPRIQYTVQEVETWGAVFNKLITLYPTHACKQHQYVFPLLIQNCGYRPDNIPQLEDISNFLRECTGFTLRPVMGLLSSRDFLNGLAFRVFHSTQYIRHHSKPLYTPEPYAFILQILCCFHSCGFIKGCLS
jgi:phenylalanine-4-hydroxylase